MKFLKLNTGWAEGFYTSPPPLHDYPGIVQVDDQKYEALMQSGVADPICTLDPVLQREFLVQSAARLNVALTTDDPEIVERGKEYGTTVHLHHSRKASAPAEEPVAEEPAVEASPNPPLSKKERKRLARQGK